MTKTLSKEVIAELNRPRLLTALSVEKLKPADGLTRTKKGDLVPVRLEIPDLGCTGLRLIIQPSGAKSWAMRFRRNNGKAAKLTLGEVVFSDRKPVIDEKTGKPIPPKPPKIDEPLSLADAHALATDIKRQRKSDIDVITEARANKRRNRTAADDAAANTFGSIAREFFIKHKTKKWNSRPRRWHEDAAVLGLKYPKGCDPATVEPEIIKGSLVAAWANRPITDFDKFLAEAAVAEAQKHGSDSRARKLFSVLNVLFGWLPLKYGVDVNPMIGMKKRLGLGPPSSRDRKLDNAEIKLFWKACDEIDKPPEDSTKRGIFGDLYKLLLLTGCRLREPGEMDRTELGDNGVWEVPGERTKNHLPFLVPMSQAALDIINAVPVTGGSNSGLVFTTTGKKPVSGFGKTKKRLDAAMAKIAGKPIKPWRLHDLRRTFSTTLNESPDDGGLGIAPHIVEACLNHVSGSRSGVAGTYNKAKYLSEKRVALERWANHIEGLVEGRKAKVVSIKRGRQ